jgi:hypothetical protein
VKQGDDLWLCAVSPRVRFAGDRAENLEDVPFTLDTS